MVCLDCWHKIKLNTPPLCLYCGRSLTNEFNGNVCNRCKQKRYCFYRAYAPCIYEGAIKELIHQFKYKGKDHLGISLGGLLAESVTKYAIPLETFDWVIPIPLHRRKMREREFNQSSILAKQLSLKFSLNLLERGLLRIRDTTAQVELPLQKRRENVRNCFKVNPKVDLKGKNILLIDDLLTTGATCSEAAEVLKKAGCNKVFVLTLAN